MLLDWRNDAATRSNSRNSGLINFEQHNAWLSGILASADHIIRIAEAGGRPIGVVRADRIAGGWELSWAVAPQARGRGLGSRMLRSFTASLDGRLLATVRKDNFASARIAGTAGFKRISGSDDPDFDHWVRE
jgi:RimJ/RimL family protein N-acetyltransferase